MDLIRKLIDTYYELIFDKVNLPLTLTSACVFMNERLVELCKLSVRSNVEISKMIIDIKKWNVNND